MRSEDQILNKKTSDQIVLGELPYLFSVDEQGQRETLRAGPFVQDLDSVRLGVTAWCSDPLSSSGSQPRWVMLEGCYFGLGWLQAVLSTPWVSEGGRELQ